MQLSNAESDNLKVLSFSANEEFGSFCISDHERHGILLHVKLSTNRVMKWKKKLQDHS